MDDLEPLALRVGDFCRAVGLGKTTVFGMIKAGELRAVRIGRRTLVPYAEARRLIERERQGEAA